MRRNVDGSGFRTIMFTLMAFVSPPVIRAEENPANAIFRKMPGITANDIDGGTVDLQTLARQGNGLAILFRSETCPVSKQYGPTFARIEKELKDRGIATVVVNPVATDPKDAIDKFRGSIPRTPYVHDAEERIAAALDVRSTTEAFLYDKALTLRYRGGIDDQFAVGTALEKPRHDWLLDAADDIAAGHDVRLAVTDPSGCVIDPHPPAGDPARKVELTFHDRISRILQKHCQECHHDGGLAPFPLVSFDDAKSHRAMIAREVTRGQMPPWFAEPAKSGEKHPGWLHDRSLPASDKADLLAWLAGGLTEGDPANAPLPKKFGDSGWAIGDPDLILRLPEPITIAAQGKMPYQIRTVETGLTEDKWLKSYEIRPSDRQAVHHVLVFLLPPKSDGGEDQRAGDDEGRGFFAAYVPGTASMTLPEGYGKKVPKGSRFRLQIHYTPYGEAAQDQLEIGLKWHDSVPSKELKVYGISNPAIEIPPGAARHVETAKVRIPADVRLLGFLPHMHVRGAAFEYAVEFPDGKRQVILDVPRYDFNWQLHYQLAEPVEVPAGSTVIATALYDNSAANRANPDPSKTVHWGQQTDEEMMLGYVEFETDTKFAMPGPGSRIANGPLARILGGGDPEQRRERLFRMLDQDEDGKLTREELGRLERFAPRLREDPARLDTLLKTLDEDDDGKLDRTELKNLRNLSGG